jgi:hypothetical protein
MEEDEKKFKTKADEKPYNEKTHAYFKTTIIRATTLIDQGTKLGKTIEAYDKIKEAATILRDIAETNEGIEDKTITINTLFRRREDVWIKALEAYNKLKEVVPTYRGDIISKLDTITNNISYWIEFNGDKRSDKYETSDSLEKRNAGVTVDYSNATYDRWRTRVRSKRFPTMFPTTGGKSKRRKSKRRKYKRKTTKRRR